MYSDKRCLSYGKRHNSDSSESDHDRHRYKNSEYKRKRHRSRSKPKSKSSHRSENKYPDHRDRKKSKKRERSHDHKKKKNKKDQKHKSPVKPNIMEIENEINIKLPDNFNLDDFKEMIPKAKKKAKPAVNQDDNNLIENETEIKPENGEEEDPLDAYMKVITTELSEKSKNNSLSNPSGKSRSLIGTTEYTEDKDDADVGPEIFHSFSAEPETLESLTQAFMEEKRQKLPDINHEKTYYRKVNFNLYKEVPEVSKMTSKEVKSIRRSLEIISKGVGCPRPITKWSHAITKPKLLQSLHYNKMEKPTPIQCQTIPAIMIGRDVIGVAKTGSGKTLAYLLPLIRHIINQDSVSTGEGPIALILCPTRELCIQIYQEIEKVTHFLRSIRSGCIYGGSDAAQQIGKIKKGIEILVATPGRMIDIMSTNSGRNLSLQRVTFVVLDEADRMFDMGFEPQVLAIIDRIRPDRQTVLFSATFPRKIEAIAKKIMKDPLEIRAGGGNKVCNDVTQHVLLLDDENKFMQLTDILAKFEDHGKILVFVEKQETAYQVSNNLNHQNYRNTPLHGGLSQEKREEAIFNFRNNKIWILIATSVAARGLDVHDLICVVNYDCPNHYEDYVHRCGRTGRAGNKGDAFTFVTPDQEIMFGWLIKALRDNNQEPEWKLLDAHNRYVERMKSEGKEIKAPSGFRGHGFKFDAAEAMREKERRLQQRQRYCPEAITEEEEGIIQQMNTGATGTEQTEENPENVAAVVSNPYEAHSHARTAHQIAARLSQRLDNYTANQMAAQAAADNASSNSTGSGENANDLFGGKVISSSNILGGSNAPPGGIEVGELVRREIDINGYPAHVRYLLTTKELRSTLLENYGVNSMVKGEYMQPRDAKKYQQQLLAQGGLATVAMVMGQRPLHLQLEAESHIALNAAEKEIIRVVKEGLNKK